MNSKDEIVTVLYCRTARKCDDAIAIQESMLRHFAAENGYNNISVYVDNGFCGLSIDGRPGLGEIRQGMASRSIGAIIVKDFSRITRGTHPLWTFANEAESHNVKLISVNNGEYNSIFGDLLACTTLQWIKASGGGMLYTGRGANKPRKGGKQNDKLSKICSRTRKTQRKIWCFNKCRRGRFYLGRWRIGKHRIYQG